MTDYALSRQRVGRILRVFAVVLFFVLVVLPFGLGFVSIWVLTHTPCGSQVAPSVYGMTDYEAVQFDVPHIGAKLNGYFVPGDNGVTVIIPPALGSGAGNWMNEFITLNQHGYSLFTYESRNCIGLANSLGYSEAEDVAAVLAYLAGRPDVDMARLAIQGFSAGGATATFAAARYPQIRAVIAMGGYHDFSYLLDHSTAGQWVGWLYNRGARLAYQWVTGQPIDVLSPVSVIGHIAPRDVLLVYGTREASLPGAYQQQIAAGPGAALVVIEGARHGGYWAADSAAYEAAVIGFLDGVFGLDG